MKKCKYAGYLLQSEFYLYYHFKNLASHKMRAKLKFLRSRKRIRVIIYAYWIIIYLKFNIQQNTWHDIF